VQTVNLSGGGPNIRKSYSQSLLEKHNELKKNHYASNSTDLLKNKIESELNRLKAYSGIRRK